MTSPSLPHAATLTLTGWATPYEKGIRVNGIRVRTNWKAEAPQRVTVVTYPRTNPDGTLARLDARRKAVHPARGKPNGSRLTVTGRLIKLDRGEGIIRVEVCPAVTETEPFVVTMQASSEVLGLDAGAFFVQVTGRLIGVGKGILLAERAAVVDAPVPERWQGWKPKRWTLPKPEAEPPTALEVYLREVTV